MEGTLGRAAKADISCANHPDTSRATDGLIELTSEA